MNAPIRVRLTLLYVLVLAAILAALIGFVVTRLRADLTSELDHSLNDAATQIAHGYRAEGAAEFHDTAATVLPGARTEPAGAQIIDSAGRVLFAHGTLRDAGPAVGPALRAQVLAGRTMTGSLRLNRPVRHLRLIVVPVERAGRREVLAVAESLSEVDHAAHRALVLLLVGAAGAVGLVGIGGWWIARRALAPVDRMTRRAAAIEIDDLAQRVPVPQVNDELAHLARTLNTMLDRLQDSIQARQALIDRLHENVLARQRLVADASHELRSPLAAMRTELDVTLRQDALNEPARRALQLARDDSERLARIVENLLTLARVDEGRLELLSSPHDLRDIAERATSSRQHAADAREVTVELRDRYPVVVDVDANHLEHAIGNLLDNAIRHSPRGGTVRVEISQDEQGAQLAVSDDGPGIPAEDRERVFERFSRQDPARPRGGAGLGLAICEEIVRAHHGRIWIEDRGAPGTTVRIALPRQISAVSQPETVHPSVLPS